MSNNWHRWQQSDRNRKDMCAIKTSEDINVRIDTSFTDYMAHSGMEVDSIHLTDNFFVLLLSLRCFLSVDDGLKIIVC